MAKTTRFGTSVRLHGGPWDGLDVILPYAYSQLLVDPEGVICVLLMGAAAAACCYKAQATATPPTHALYVLGWRDAGTADYIHERYPGGPGSSQPYHVDPTLLE